jgi:hypothetical protein
MRLPTSDLDLALEFVIERITQEAVCLAEPLDDDEEYFLRHLPTEPINPTAGLASGFNFAYEDSLPTPVLRDLRFERLCKLAKNVRSNDLRTHSDALRQWEFAAAVLQLNRHPMSWLLGWAGIRVAKRSARWDGLLLVATALFIVALSVGGALALSVLTDGQNVVWNWTLWVAGGCIYAAVLILLYFAVRRLEGRQGERDVERVRCNLPVRGSTQANS